MNLIWNNTHIQTLIHTLSNNFLSDVQMKKFSLKATKNIFYLFLLSKKTYVLQRLHLAWMASFESFRQKFAENYVLFWLHYFFLIHIQKLQRVVVKIRAGLILKNNTENYYISSSLSSAKWDLFIFISCDVINEIIAHAISNFNFDLLLDKFTMVIFDSQLSFVGRKISTNAF